MGLLEKLSLPITELRLRVSVYNQGPDVEVTNLSVRACPTNPFAQPAFSQPMNLRLIAALTLFCGLVIVSRTVGAADDAPLPVAAEPSRYVETIVPFLKAHCVDCHSGDEPEADLSFSRFASASNVQEEYSLWERVLRLVEEREMPPADRPQPDEAELIDVGRALRAELDSFDCSGDQRPGRVTIRRLNRVEYNNTIRDLVGIAFRPADDFPSDDVGHGFDNIADVLSMSPILLEKYLGAAESIVAETFKDPTARRRIEADSGELGPGWTDRLRRDVTTFATRAFRRPVAAEEVDRLIALSGGDRRERGGRNRRRGGRPESDGEPFANDPLRIAATAILTSPHFLFRIERDPEASAESAESAQPSVRRLNDYEIASRLSYFLWSSMPDEELFALAADGELGRPETLFRQVDRMLADPKSEALVKHFAGQWLQLRDVAVLSPDPGRYPEFDDSLRAAMLGETEHFFEAVMREDRSVLDFLDADFSFINERLARHYGIDGVDGDSFRRVSLPAQRRGVLTHASILMLTSNPTRTSPVKRGQWILGNILGEPPPPPPPDVEELDEDGETLGSLRERMEQHRANPSCSVCHRQMDALGFGLENFDPIGGWRDRDGRFEIDPSGELPGNQTFAGPAELMKLLAKQKRDAFCRCLSEKMLTYGLGRGLGPYDRCAVNSILNQLAENDDRFSALIKAIVTSEPFLYREVLGAE